MSTAVGTGLHDGPSVLRQVVRASLGTFTVLAVIGALVAAVVYGRDTAVSVWWRVAGDSSVTAADGATFSEVATAAVAPVMSGSTASFDTALDELAAPFGGDAVLVRTAAALRAEAPYVDPSMAGDRADLVVPMAVTPAGVLRIFPGSEAMSGSLHLWGGPEAPVAVGEAAQSELVARLTSDVLAVAGTTVEVAVLPTQVPTSGPGTMWSVELGLPGCDVCRVWTSNLATFSEDGRLTNASFALAAITGLTPVTAPSASQALDDARHHRGASTVWMNGAPIGSATLTVGDLATQQTFTAWNLIDTRGAVVAQVPVLDAG